MLFNSFNHANRFRPPSDQELTHRYEGIPVFSHRPEDLPHFETLLKYECGPSERHDRALTLLGAIEKNTSCADKVCFEDLFEQATSLSANVMMDVTKSPFRKRTINFFMLLRPSEKILPAEMFAYNAKIPPNKALSAVPQADKIYIDTMHEIGHMEDDVSGQSFLWNDWTNELSAETYALNAYKNEGGSRDVIEHVILQRSIEGFLNQPAKYFIAPALHQIFNEHRNSHRFPGDMAKLCRAEVTHGIRYDTSRRSGQHTVV